MTGPSAAAFRLVVEEGRVHRFAAAVGAQRAEHHRAHDPVAPATFLVTADDWQRGPHRAWPGLRGREARLLHGAQRVELVGPAPRAGTELWGTEQLVGQRRTRGQRGGGLTLTTLAQTFRSADGATVARHQAVWIETGQPALEPGVVTPPPPGDLVLAHDPGPLTLADTIAYQAASGDLNPIHHDPALAGAAGYPAPFGVGMRQAGVLAALVSDRYGADALRVVDLRFGAIAWHGEPLSYRVHDAGPDEATGHRQLAVQVRRPDGAAHLSGRMLVAAGS